MDSPPWQCPCAWYVKCLQVPGREVHYKNGPSTLFTWLSPLRFLALSKIKKCPEGTKICWPFWHQMQHENFTAGYSGKRFSRLSSSGTIVSPSADLHKESISKATAAASAQLSKFCFHRAILGIKLSHLVHQTDFIHTGQLQMISTRVKISCTEPKLLTLIIVFTWMQDQVFFP